MTTAEVKVPNSCTFNQLVSLACTHTFQTNGKSLLQRSIIPLSVVRMYTENGDLLSLDPLQSDEGESDNDEELE